MELITQIPVNPYVMAICLVLGWVMKHWLPTDNKIIPTCLVVVGAVMFPVISGWSVINCISGALSGALATGLHQQFAQYINKNTEEKGLEQLEKMTANGENGENFFEEEDDKDA